jgi:uncharacterized membrane protein (DUF373 family)
MMLDISCLPVFLLSCFLQELISDTIRNVEAQSCSCNDAVDADPPRRRAPERIVQVFESAELILYGAVGVLLVVIALVALAGEVDSIVSYFVTDSPIIGLNFLIAAIIALELLMTVVGYMKTRSINLGLLLGAGLTAMIRDIIVFGYQPTDLQNFEVILLATAVLVAALYFVDDKTIHTYLRARCVHAFDRFLRFFVPDVDD